jgi:hypothetical protein
VGASALPQPRVATVAMAEGSPPRQRVRAG